MIHTTFVERIPLIVIMCKWHKSNLNDINTNYNTWSNGTVRVCIVFFTVFDIQHTLNNNTWNNVFYFPPQCTYAHSIYFINAKYFYYRRRKKNLILLYTSKTLSSPMNRYRYSTPVSAWYYNFSWSESTQMSRVWELKTFVYKHRTYSYCVIIFSSRTHSPW